MVLAGSLLVFTGFWHAFERMMGGRNRDTLALIQLEIIYIVLGYVIVTITGGIAVPTIAIIIAIAGLFIAFMTHMTQAIAWVMWVFIALNIVIILGLLAGILT